jgi:hypothetical protein
LSLWEPWATAFRLGLKTVETRGRRMNYRGPLLICAAKSRNGVKIADEDPILGDALDHRIHTPAGMPFAKWPGWNFGKAVALVNVVGCANVDHLHLPSFFDTLPPTERVLGDYSPGRFVIVTTPLTLSFDPFPVTGAQGLFNVDLDPDGPLGAWTKGAI